MTPVIGPARAELVPGGRAVSMLQRRLPVPFSRSTAYRMLDRFDLKVGRSVYVPPQSISAITGAFNHSGPWLSLATAHRIFSARLHLACSHHTFRRHLAVETEKGDLLRFGRRYYVSWPALERLIESERALLHEARKVKTLVWVSRNRRARVS